MGKRMAEENKEKEGGVFPKAKHFYSLEESHN